MNEKYASWPAYYGAHARLWPVRQLLRTTARWQPMRNPEPGYTIVIGCIRTLPAVLEANLAMLEQQRREHLREIILVMDCRPGPEALDREAAMRDRYPELPLRVIYYSRWQDLALKALGSAWCYCWLNWVLGIAATRTRYAILHDLDAMLLEPHLIEQRYEAIRERRDHYLGVEMYVGNGITLEDGLAVTFEMMFDVEHVRRRHHPLDLFNRAARRDGRRIQYDTFLYPQSQAGAISTLGIDGTEMVHPAQLACQYKTLTRRAGYVPPERNNLPLLAYFDYLAGDGGPLEAQTEAIERLADGIPLAGRRVSYEQLSVEHVTWLDTQTRRMERAVAGEVRPEVERYLHALRRFAERSREDSAARDQLPAAAGRARVGGG
ncbi:MAG: hypothetical protein ACLFV3_07100 [Phycisphaeraceae bacterium]